MTHLFTAAQALNGSESYYAYDAAKTEATLVQITRAIQQQTKLSQKTSFTYIHTEDDIDLAALVKRLVALGYFVSNDKSMGKDTNVIISWGNHEPHDGRSPG